MNSIADFEKKMTVFYSKQTGEIKAICYGIQDMNYFGDNRVDFEIIYDFIIVEKDEYVFNNMMSFKVEEGKIKLKDTVDVSKYL